VHVVTVFTTFPVTCLECIIFNCFVNAPRNKITQDAVQPANTRYDVTCDCVQTRASETSPWVDNPAADPRHADSFRMPPREGENARCDAAEAMMQHFKAAVDVFLTSANILLFVNAIIALVSIFFPPIALFSRGIFLVFEALLTIGTTVVDEAMTPEVYDQIKCILFNNIDEDGQMSAAQLATIQSEIDTQIGGTPNLVFDLFAGLWGEVQWSNAGATGEYTGDCDDCAPWAELCDFTLSDYGFEPTLFGATPLAVYTPGVGFESIYTPTGLNGYTISSIARAFAADVTHIELTFAYTQGSCFASGDAALYIYSEGFVHEFYRLNVCDVPTSPVTWDFEPTPGVPVTITQLQIAATAGVTPDDTDPGGSATLISLRVCGVGAPPGVGVPDDPC